MNNQEKTTLNDLNEFLKYSQTNQASQIKKESLSIEEMEPQKLAQTAYESFLLTDLMVKGSFLLFNFWLSLKEAQKSLKNEEKSSL